jgi:hypothetical protein
VINQILKFGDYADNDNTTVRDYYYNEIKRLVPLADILNSVSNIDIKYIFYLYPDVTIQDFIDNGAIMQLLDMLYLDPFYFNFANNK